VYQGRIFGGRVLTIGLFGEERVVTPAVVSPWTRVPRVTTVWTEV
jgi:hypothetical protein